MYDLVKLKSISLNSKEYFFLITVISSIYNVVY